MLPAYRLFMYIYLDEPVVRTKQAEHRDHILLLDQLGVGALQVGEIDRCRRETGQIPGSFLVHLGLQQEKKRKNVIVFMPENRRTRRGDGCDCGRTKNKRGMVMIRLILFTHDPGCGRGITFGACLFVCLLVCLFVCLFVCFLRWRGVTRARDLPCSSLALSFRAVLIVRQESAE